MDRLEQYEAKRLWCETTAITYHLRGLKVVSINGIERTGGRTAFKRQGDQVSGIFRADPEKSHLARKYFSKPGIFQNRVKFLHFKAFLSDFN